MLDTTPRPQTCEDVWSHVTDSRWSQYQSGVDSVSMMDHYYDKLLHIAKFDPAVVRSSYMCDLATRRVQPLVDICVEAGVTGQAPVESIIKLEKTL